MTRIVRLRTEVSAVLLSEARYFLSELVAAAHETHVKVVPLCREVTDFGRLVVRRSRVSAEQLFDPPSIVEIV